MMKDWNRSNGGVGPSGIAVSESLGWHHQMSTSAPVTGSDGPATYMLALLCLSSVPWTSFSSLARKKGCKGKISSRWRVCRLNSWGLLENRIQVTMPKNVCSCTVNQLQTEEVQKKALEWASYVPPALAHVEIFHPEAFEHVLPREANIFSLYTAVHSVCPVICPFLAVPDLSQIQIWGSRHSTWSNHWLSLSN